MNKSSRKILNAIYIDDTKYVLFEDDSVKDIETKYEILKIKEGKEYEIEDIDELRDVYSNFLDTIEIIDEQVKQQLLQNFDENI